MLFVTRSVLRGPTLLPRAQARQFYCVGTFRWVSDPEGSVEKGHFHAVMIAPLILKHLDMNHRQNSVCWLWLSIMMARMPKNPAGWPPRNCERTTLGPLWGPTANTLVFLGMLPQVALCRWWPQGSTSYLWPPCSSAAPGPWARCWNRVHIDEWPICRMEIKGHIFTVTVFIDVNSIYCNSVILYCWWFINMGLPLCTFGFASNPYVWYAAGDGQKWSIILHGSFCRNMAPLFGVAPWIEGLPFTFLLARSNPTIHQPSSSHPLTIT